MKAIALINERAGTVSAAGAESVREILCDGCRVAGWEIDAETGEAEALVEAASAAGNYDAAIAVGGDGTLAAIAGALLGRNIAFLPMPCGTVNMFCRDLGLPMSISDALAVGLASEPKKVDVGRVTTEELGDRVFLNNVVFGAYADLAGAREELRNPETLADVNFALVEASAAIVRAKPIEYLVNLDGAERNFTTTTLVIGNNPFTEASGLIPRRSRLDTGALAVYLVAASNGIEFTARLIEFLTRAGRDTANGTPFACERCSVSADEKPITFAIDGDPFETAAPVVMSIAAGALTVLAPLAGEPAKTAEEAQQSV
jgi:diacylglycerol kinase family enzyme